MAGMAGVHRGSLDFTFIMYFDDPVPLGTTIPSTTVGDHVGILSVVLLFLPLLEVPMCPWIVPGPYFWSIVSGERVLFIICTPHVDLRVRML